MITLIHRTEHRNSAPVEVNIFRAGHIWTFTTRLSHNVASWQDATEISEAR